MAVEPYYMQSPNHDALTANYIASKSEGFLLNPSRPAILPIINSNIVVFGFK